MKNLDIWLSKVRILSDGSNSEKKFNWFDMFEGFLWIFTTENVAGLIMVGFMDVVEPVLDLPFLNHWNFY